MNILKLYCISDDSYKKVAIADSSVLPSVSNSDYKKIKSLLQSDTVPNFVWSVTFGNTGDYFFIKQDRDAPATVIHKEKKMTEDESLRHRSLIHENDEYFIRIRCNSRLVEVDSNNHIIYPFKFYDITTNGKSGSDINISIVSSVLHHTKMVAVEFLEQPTVVSDILTETSVDISNYVKILKSQNFSYIHVDRLSKYINLHSKIPEFRRCINLGIPDTVDWVGLKEPTIKKKSVTICKLLDVNLGDNIPDYIRSFFGETRCTHHTDNLISLHNLGFTENNFKLYIKLFTNFGTTHFSRFMMIYDMHRKYQGNTDIDRILDIVKHNSDKGHRKSVPAFFATLSYYQRASDTIQSLGEEFMKKAYNFICNDFLTDDIYNALYEEIKTENNKNFYELFCQYPDIDFNNDYLQRITCFDDLSSDWKSLFCRYSFANWTFDYIDALEPQKDEILFILKDNDSIEQQFLIKVNLNSKSFRAYELTTSRFETLYSRDKSIEEKFNTYLSRIFNRFIFPVYIEKTLKEMF